MLVYFDTNWSKITCINEYRLSDHLSAYMIVGERLLLKNSAEQKHIRRTRTIDRYMN